MRSPSILNDASSLEADIRELRECVSFQIRHYFFIGRRNIIGHYLCKVQCNTTGVNMRLSSKSRFAVNAMIDLARHQESGPVSLRVISSHQNISLSYLESMFSQLRQSYLVASSRGPGGGYSLGRDACLITIADIIDALEEMPYLYPYDSRNQSIPYLATNELWNSMNAKALEYLRSVRLSDLLSKSPTSPMQLDDSHSRPLKKHGVSSRVVQPTIHRHIPNSVFALGQMNSGRT
jgi:Rrf2 family iron-sulfur cluster assembly transcriptional regulator